MNYFSLILNLRKYWMWDFVIFPRSFYILNWVYNFQKIKEFKSWNKTIAKLQVKINIYLCLYILFKIYFLLWRCPLNVRLNVNCITHLCLKKIFFFFFIMHNWRCLVYKMKKIKQTRKHFYKCTYCSKIVIKLKINKIIIYTQNLFFLLYKRILYKIKQANTKRYVLKSSINFFKNPLLKNLNAAIMA